ncbi:hypothetical protein Ancab_012363 [Ancistrocladus abbreviatus]
MKQLFVAPDEMGWKPQKVPIIPADGGISQIRKQQYSHFPWNFVQRVLTGSLRFSDIANALGLSTERKRGDEVDALKFTELFLGRHFRVVFIGSALFALQQLSGINAVFYFSSAVFRRAGVPSDVANISVGIVNLSGSFVATILMDKLGRKVLLLGSFLGMAMSMALQVGATTSFVSTTGALYLSVGGMLL